MIKGKLVKNFTNNPDMTRTEIFDENEKISTEFFEHHTENYSYEKYFSDESLTKAHYLYPEFERTQTFDSRGNMLSWIENNSKENSYTEYYWTYYDNGNISRYIIKCTDSYYTRGMYHEEQYYPSGVMSMHYQVSQFGDNKFYYDENGNKTRFEGKNNFGEWVEIDY